MVDLSFESLTHFDALKLHATEEQGKGLLPHSSLHPDYHHFIVSHSGSPPQPALILWEGHMAPFAAATRIVAFIVAPVGLTIAPAATTQLEVEAVRAAGSQAMAEVRQLRLSRHPGQRSYKIGSLQGGHGCNYN